MKTILSDIAKIREKKYLEKEKHKGKDNFLVHITYPYVVNAGDTVLSKAVRDTILYFSRGQWSFRLVSVKKNLTYKDIKEYNNAGAIIIGGGGLFLPDTNLNSKSGWQWQCSVKQYSLLKVPLILFAVGYNYFPGQNQSILFRNNIRALVERADFVGLRNNGSVNAIRQILPDSLKEKVIWQPCPTTILNKLYRIKRKRKTKKIAVNVAFDRANLRYGSEQEKRYILEEIASAIQKIEKNGYKIYYVAHMKTDLQFLPFLDEKVIKYKVKDLSKEYPVNVFRFYSKIDLVIGMRGHSQMIPFGVGCGIITLGTHDKMRWFLEDINALDLYVDLREEKNVGAKIIKIFNENYGSRYNETKQRLKKEQDKLYMVTVNNMKIINSII